MTRIDNLKQGETARQQEKQKRLAFGSNGESSSIDRGQFRVGGTAKIKIDGSGGIEIDGTLDGGGSFFWRGQATFDGDVDITNTLDVSATTTLRGPTTIENTLDVTADTTLSGATTIENTLDVDAETTLRGDVQLTADLRVDGAGKIYVGSAMVLDPTIAGGAIVFSNGAQLFTNPAEIEMFKAGSAVSVRDLKVVIVSPTVEISAADLHLYTLPTIARDASHQANLWIDPANGRIHRLT